MGRPPLSVLLFESPREATIPKGTSIDVSKWSPLDERAQCAGLQKADSPESVVWELDMKYDLFAASASLATRGRTLSAPSVTLAST